MSQYYHYQLGLRKSKRALYIAAAGIMAMALMLLFVTSAQAKKNDSDETRVPGHTTDRYDGDGNGISDAGVYVNGHYTALYAYDGSGAWYWDLGDGRVRGTVGSVDDLDQSTLTTCDYVNNYRADFGNDPFMDKGWIHNNINCSGVDSGHWNYLFVHESDPRYTGDPAKSAASDFGAGWEYHVLTESGSGNIVKAGPQNHVE